MKTYWIRLKVINKEYHQKYLDTWVTGYDIQREYKFICFAIRTDNDDSISTMLDKVYPKLVPVVDFIEERSWSKYGDFASTDGRFRMNEKYLNDTIDTVEDVLARIK